MIPFEKVKLELKPGEPVTITILGQTAQLPAEAQILAVSGRRMTISSPLTASVGVAVQIQSPDYVVLAEVLTVQAGSEALVVQIRHVLRTNELEYIHQQWT